MTPPKVSERELPIVREILAIHIQRCRDAAADCPNWSPAQAEWSRARDELLNFQDNLNQALARAESGQ